MTSNFLRNSSWSLPEQSECAPLRMTMIFTLKLYYHSEPPAGRGLVRNDISLFVFMKKFMNRDRVVMFLINYHAIPIFMDSF